MVVLLSMALVVLLNELQPGKIKLELEYIANEEYLEKLDQVEIVYYSLHYLQNIICSEQLKENYKNIS